MIERLYLKNCLSFDEVDIEFKRGLIVFTGPSGAGKSILLNSILALFGLKQPNAKLSEITLVDNSLDLESFGFEKEDIIVIKEIKKEKSRFFINSQTVSKKVLKTIFKDKVSYLSQKDEDIFKSKNILKIIDDVCVAKFSDFLNLKKSFLKKFQEYREVFDKLNQILQEERRVNDLKEFAKFEIEKINQISPKIGEYEELLEIKKDLSKREKILEAIKRVENIFDFEQSVYEFLEYVNKDSSFFDEAMNELKNIIEEERYKLLELENIDIESVLNRLEELSNLKRKYGSIKEALKYKEVKIKELEHYENLEFEKKDLENKKEKLFDELKELSKKITKYRIEAAKELEGKINLYLKDLKLPSLNLVYEKKELDNLGEDRFDIRLNGARFEDISSGEFNRVRLSLLAAWSGYKDEKDQILILDEIDANVSGEESIAIAKILKKLSKNYQIFAISHQPQLSSLANQHFLVVKEDGKSKVFELKDKKRVDEIARIISGEKITKEAKEFAKKMLEYKGE